MENQSHKSSSSGSIVTPLVWYWKNGVVTVWDQDHQAGCTISGTDGKSRVSYYGGGSVMVNLQDKLWLEEVVLAIRMFTDIIKSRRMDSED